MMNSKFVISPSFKLNDSSYNSKELFNKALIWSATGTDEEKVLGSFLQEWLDVKETIDVKTSGSTGTPKIIKLQKQHMINSALATGAYFNMKENTKALCCLSAEYIAGKMMLVRAMVLGWNLKVVSPSGNPLSNITDHFDFCAMVPMQVQASLSQLDQVHNLIIGGGAISENLLASLQGISTNCFATYGMTETITHIAVKKLNKIVNEEVSYYELLPDVTIALDERSCLLINAPKLGAVQLQTNDIVALKGQYAFEWLGRFDHVINSGGVKLFPEQIEKVLAQYISDRFFVYGIPDERLGQKLILLIEGEKKNLDLEHIVKNQTQLTKFQRPKEVFYVQRFKETPTGKIQRRATIKALGTL